MLQVYIQQVINQTFATMASCSGEDGEQGEEDSAETANTLQVSDTPPSSALKEDETTVCSLSL